MLSVNRISRYGAVLAASLFTSSAAFGQSIMLSPKNGPPETSIEVSGGGFSPGASVDIYFDDQDQVLATPDSSGSLSKLAISVPAPASPGQHTVSAVPRGGGAATQTSFTVRTNWTEYGFSAQRTFDNAHENVLSASTVSRLGLKWSFPAGGAITSSPAVSNGVVYFGSQDGNVYALDDTTGTELWSYTTGAGVSSSPAVIDGLLFVGSDAFYALDATTGTEVWSAAIAGTSSPAVENGVVYFATLQPTIFTGGSVYALNARTGEPLWQYTTPIPFNYSCWDVAVAYTTVYGGCENLTLRLDATTGQIIWRRNDGPAVAAAGGVVYTTSGYDILFAIEPGGSVLWKYGLGGGASSAVSAPAVSNDAAYAGIKGGSLSAVNLTSGASLWTANGQFTTTPAVANGVVYIGSDQEMHALDGSTGKVLWTHKAPAGCAAVVANGTLYFCSGDALYAFGLPGSQAPERLVEGDQ